MGDYDQEKKMFWMVPNRCPSFYKKFQRLIMLPESLERKFQPYLIRASIILTKCEQQNRTHLNPPEANETG